MCLPHLVSCLSEAKEKERERERQHERERVRERERVYVSACKRETGSECSFVDREEGMEGMWGRDFGWVPSLEM